MERVDKTDNDNKHGEKTTNKKKESHFILSRWNTSIQENCKILSGISSDN